LRDEPAPTAFGGEFDIDQADDERERRTLLINLDDELCVALVAAPDPREPPGAGERIGDARTYTRIVDHDAYFYAPGRRLHDRLSITHETAAVRPARVITVGRNAAWVVFEDEVQPRLAAFRKKDRHAMLVPGDLVGASVLDDDHVVIDRLIDRSFVLERRTGAGRTKLMAANVDALAIVAALVEPPIHLGMVDRLVAFATLHDLHVLLLLTKADLAGATFTESVASIYRSLGYTTLLVQPKTGAGIDELRAAIAERRALLVGNSGVGKSSTFRALGGTSVVGDLSRYGIGKQTTTSARLFRMGDGFLIDSPGIGDFLLDPMPPAELAELFVEMRVSRQSCRFADCRHVSEPDCAVLRAVAAGEIAASRYESYRELVTTAR